MDETTQNALENLFLALSDKTRLRLLSLMANGEVSVGYLADSLGESQPKISRHLAYLRSAELVSTRRDGKWIYYNIERPANAVAGDVLDAAFGRVDVRELSEKPTYYGDEYVPSEQSWSNDEYTFDETDMNVPEREEMPIYLL
jgi:DNA-binding transcriptional ArsR family regulator